MKKRNFIYAAAVVLICAVAMTFCGCHTYDAAEDIPAIENSDSAYLLEEDTTITTENFAAYFRDYLAAPAALWLDEDGIFYRNEAPESRASLGKLLEGVILKEIPYETFQTAYQSGESCGLTNAICHISFVFESGNTYICCYRDFDHPICFIAETDLRDNFMKARDEILAESKKVTNNDEITQFE